MISQSLMGLGNKGLRFVVVPPKDVFTQITLIFHTPHASEVFVTPIATFENMHVQLKFAIETST
jgi:hypothetical protein